jgi:phytoene dehydrogenase-like protein
VIIVGAGTAGLTAGAYLAKHGMSVVIFDPHYVAGGCGTMFTRTSEVGDFHFDVGLHYIGDCAPGGQIPSLMEPLGVDVTYRPMDQDGFDTLVFSDYRFRIPASVDAYRDRLVADFPAETKGIDRYVRLLREVMHLGKITSGARGRSGQFKLAWEAVTRGRLAARSQNATLADVLNTCTDDPLLRAVIAGQSGDYALPPSQVSAMLHCGLAGHYFKGAYYPEGGGQVFADGMAEVIEAHGGVVRLKCGVEKIEIEDGRVTGVRTEPIRGTSHTVKAPVVVSAADLTVTLEKLIGLEHLPASWSERVAGFEIPQALSMMFVGVEGDLGDFGLSDTNLWVFGDTDMERLYAEVAGGNRTPQGAYITSASLKDPNTPGHAPDGHMGIEVMALSPGSAEAWGVDPSAIASGAYQNNAVYLDRKAQLQSDLMGWLESVAPGIGQKVVFQEAATPITHGRYTRSTGNTAYGLSATPRQFLKNRPGYRLPIEGMYLAGVSTRAGHGIVGAMLSGHNAALRVARDAGRPLGA